MSHNLGKREGRNADGLDEPGNVMRRLLLTVLTWLVLLSSAMAGEPLKILHNMRFADPTGENTNPWLFSRQVGDSVGGVFCQLLAHGKIFSKPGVVDFEKLRKAAELLEPGPLMLNVEGHENRCFNPKTLQLIPENVQRRVAIVQCVREHGPPGLEIGFFAALPPCEPWLVTGQYIHVKIRPQRRGAWERLVRELERTLAPHVDCCFVECYPSRDWPSEAVLWHIRRTVRAVNDVYHLPAYPTFFVSGWYPEWGDVPNEKLAQMENRIPGAVFESWLQESQRQGAAGVLIFGGKAADLTHIEWDEEAAWWQVVCWWASQLMGERDANSRHVDCRHDS